MRKRKSKISIGRYMVAASHPGLDADLDARIEDKAGRKPLGTGFDFRAGRRDLDFGFHRSDAAYRAAARIRAIRGTRASVVDLKRV